jgi:hypothetical protein
LAEPPNADVLLGWTATGTVLVAGSGASGRRWHALELTNDSADVVGRSASSATVRLWNHSQNFQFSYDPNRGRIGFVVDSPGVRQRDPQPRDADVVVISVNDGAVEQRHPLGTIWWGAAVVGWTTDGSPVVNELPAVEGATDATQPLVRSAQLVVPTDASTVPLVTSPLVSDEKSVIVIQPAADVLAGGEVRQAQPPYQPWYDPRTLVPQLLRSPAALVAIAAVVLAGGFLVRSVLSRRQRRKAVSRSGS